MTERVIPLDVGVTWEPNAPEAVLLSDDSSRAVLAVRPHFDDSDDRCVVMTWAGAQAAIMSPPNDEARHTHRLYDHGLGILLGVGTVQDSMWLASIAPMVATSPARHYVVVLKEGVVEVLADELTVERIPGSTGDAAVVPLSRHA